MKQESWQWGEKGTILHGVVRMGIFGEMTSDGRPGRSKEGAVG